VVRWDLVAKEARLDLTGYQEVRVLQVQLDHLAREVTLEPWDYLDLKGQMDLMEDLVLMDLVVNQGVKGLLDPEVLMVLTAHLA